MIDMGALWFDSSQLRSKIILHIRNLQGLIIFRLLCRIYPRRSRPLHQADTYFQPQYPSQPIGTSTPRRPEYFRRAVHRHHRTSATIPHRIAATIAMVTPNVVNPARSPFSSRWSWSPSRGTRTFIPRRPVTSWTGRIEMVMTDRVRMCVATLPRVELNETWRCERYAGWQCDRMYS
jgi:hypothetical protein